MGEGWLSGRVRCQVAPVVHRDAARKLAARGPRQCARQPRSVQACGWPGLQRPPVCFLQLVPLRHLEISGPRVGSFTGLRVVRGQQATRSSSASGSGRALPEPASAGTARRAPPGGPAGPRGAALAGSVSEEAARSGWSRGCWLCTRGRFFSGRATP